MRLPRILMAASVGAAALLGPLATGAQAPSPPPPPTPPLTKVGASFPSRVITIPRLRKGKEVLLLQSDVQAAGTRDVLVEATMFRQGAPVPFGDARFRIEFINGRSALLQLFDEQAMLRDPKYTDRITSWARTPTQAPVMGFRLYAIDVPEGRYELRVLYEMRK